MQSSISILLLASSFMSGGRCVAGKVVDPKGSGLAPGQWIRLVRPHGSGKGKEIPKDWISQFTPSPDAIPVLEVTLIEPCRITAQPENWIVDLSQEPRLCEMHDSSVLPELVDDFDPWHDASGVGTISASHSRHSLQLYHSRYGASLVKSSSSYLTPSGSTAVKTKCTISFRDSLSNSHTATILDPQFLGRNPWVSGESSTGELPDEFYIVLSLPEKFGPKSLRYKIAATIFA